MGSFARVFPFLWPYRRKLFLSVGFALLVAILWGANLSLTLPIVKILMQKESLTDWVDNEIAAMEGEISYRRSRLETADAERQKPLQKGQLNSGEASFEKAKREARQRSKLSVASQKMMILKWIKSYVMPWVPRDKFDTLALLLVILLCATLLKGVAIFVQDVLIGSVVELGVMGIRKECFRRTLALDYQTVSINGTADTMSRFTNDISVLANGLLLLGGKVVREPLKAAVCIVCAFMVNWRLTLLSLLFVPLMALVFYRYGQILKQASQRMMESMSRIYKSLEETFEAMKIVIAFDAARRHRQRFHRENREYYHKAMKVVRIDALTSPTTELLGMLAVCVALLPGAYLVLRGTDEIWNVRLSAGPMDIAQLSLLYALLAGIIDPVRKLSSVYAKLKRSAAAADRVFALIDRRSLVTEPVDPGPLPRHSKSITFHKVSFRYAAGGENGHNRPAVLDEVNLKVNAGEVTAIVGENGSGKTTLVNLLPRFYDPEHGAVLIDDIDIRQVRLRDLRAQIGVVTQETLLFDDTVYENIRYGKPNASRDEIIAAARSAHVTQFVEQLPEGFETWIGEKGQLLSGGQRQRVALARAILRDPAILILDEATSAVDAQSESAIQDVLGDFVKGRTTFLITHSLNRRVLGFATRIVLLDDGEIVANGPHASLLESSQAYQEFYKAQSEQQSVRRDENAGDSPPSAMQSTNLAQTDSVENDVSAENDPHVIPFPIVGTTTVQDSSSSVADAIDNEPDDPDDGEGGIKKTAN